MRKQIHFIFDTKYYLWWMVEKKNNPTSFKLGELKAILQKEAMRLDRSLHWIVLKALREFIKNIKK